MVRPQTKLAGMLLTWWAALGAGGATPVACPTPAAGADPVIVLANAQLQLGLEPERGSLVQLVDTTAPVNRVGDGGGRVGLWQLTLRSGNRKIVLDPEQAREFRCTPAATGCRLDLTWSGFIDPEATDYRVEVGVELNPDWPACRWTIVVTKPPDVELERVHFPRLAGLRRGTRERLAVPLWMGQQLAEPRSLLRTTAGRPRRLAWSYPGAMSLQCVAFYEQDGPGLYLACDDTDVLRKSFALWGNAQADVGCEIVHEPVARAVGVRRFTLPYGIVVGAFQGDWLTAATRYRSWAAEQAWARHSRLARQHVPPWVLDTGLWVWNRGRSPGVLEPAAKLQDRLGLPVSVFWHWWHGCAYDIGFPEYFPPREGTEPFRRAVASAHDRGLHMLVYMNQRAWGLATESWRRQGAEQFAVKDPDGKIHREVYNIFTGQALVPMCLGTRFWRDTYAGLAQRAVCELGVDGIYMDQACSQLPCYDPHHGHPPGGGTSWITGFRDLAADIRDRCRTVRQPALAGEGCGEAWLPDLDLMLALQVSRERYAAPHDPWEPIPFFQAVYHDCAVTYGSYSSLVEPPYDELWPTEYAPATPLQLLDRKYAPQFYLEQARTFVWGQQLCLANFRSHLLDQRAAEIDFLIRLAQVRQQTRKYLLEGVMLPEPEWETCFTESEFSRLSIYAGRKDRVTTYTRRHPLALATAWRAPDGDVAIAVVSIATEPLPVTLTMNRKRYQLPDGAVRGTWIDATSRRSVPLDDRQPLVARLTLAPRSGGVLELGAVDPKSVELSSSGTP